MKKHSASPNIAAIGLLSFAILFVGFTTVAANTPTVITYSDHQVLGDTTNELPEVTDAPHPSELPHPSEPPHSSESPRPGSDARAFHVEAGDRGKTQVEIGDHGTAQGEIVRDGKVFKFHVENGHMRIETHEGKKPPVPASSQDIQKAEDTLRSEEIHISTDEGKLQIEHKGIPAHSDFPISVNPTDKKLTVTTPAGQQSVTTLPDTAVENLIKTRVATPNASSSAVDLVTREGKLVYRIDGQKRASFLGVIPVNLPTTAFVSTETGKVVAQEQSLLSSILSFFSK